VEALAAALAEPRDTLEDVVEPFLIQQGYVGRTPRGRQANRKAYAAIGRREPEKGQGGLF
jgi:Holliday junction DNA helicase RuvB